MNKNIRELINDQKFTKIRKTLYQRNSYIGHTQQTLNAFLCIFIFRTYYIYFDVRNFKSIYEKLLEVFCKKRCS